MTTSRPWWKRFRGGKKTLGTGRTAARRSRPTIESLETRLTLTVSFTPNFGTEKTQPTNLGLPTYMQDPPIYPIFWGSSWQSNPLKVQVLDIALGEVVGLRGGAYLSGIDQYTSEGGTANFYDPYVDSSNPPTYVQSDSKNGDVVSTEVSLLFSENNNPIPTPFDTYAPPIYVVITDPTVTDPADNYNAFNEAFYDYNISISHPLPQNYDVIWVSTQSAAVSPQNPIGLNVDFSTRVFSHELVEAMSDPFGTNGGTVVSAGGSFPSNTSAGAPGTQIADNEPNNNYVYRLGGPFGVIVQAFWSDDAFDKDYIVEDGNQLNMKIDTTNGWTKVNGQLTFTGGTLKIDANQPNNIDPKYVGNQSISLEPVAIGGGTGVEVVMDGQTFDFEPGTINAIQLDAADDSETIDIGSLPAGVPVTINLGSGNNGQLYTIGLGDTQAQVTVNNNKGGDALVQIDGIQAGVIVNNSGGGTMDVQIAEKTSLSGIHGAIGVVGGGDTRIEVNDDTNSTDTTYTLDWAQGSRLRTDANHDFSLTYSGITTLSLVAGTADDKYDLRNWLPGLGLESLVSISTAASQVFGGSGSTTVLGVNQSTTWYLTEPTSGYATFPNTTDTVALDWAGSKRLTIQGGGLTRGGGKVSADQNTFYVEATGVPTFLDTGPGNDTVYVGGPGRSDKRQNGDSLDPIQAPLTVDGQAGTNTMNVEDQGAASPEDYSLTTTTLTRPGAALITFGSIENFTLQGGAQGNTFEVAATPKGMSVTLDTGSGANTVSVGGTSLNLDTVQGPLTVDDQGKDTLNLNDQGSGSDNVYTLTSAFPSTTLARKGAALITFSETIAAANLAGGSGDNTLKGGSPAVWVIDATDAGQWNGNVSFVSMENLAGGSMLDTFQFVGMGGNITGSLEGGGGSLDFTAASGPAITVDLQARQASRIAGTFSGISAMLGSTSTTNTLRAANAFNDWSITQPDQGIVTGLTPFAFQRVQNLVGGTGVDVFRFSPGAAVSSIDGGGAPPGQGDWLDDSAIATGVAVDLANGSATLVNNGAAGSVTDIQDVRGGWISSLIGDAQGNILLGGGGPTTISGGTGRSLLIGGGGASTITGGSSGTATGGDILIAGLTAYDSPTKGNLTALMAIFSEWQSTIDSLGKRFKRINTGAIPGGYELRYGTTVFGSPQASTLIDPSSPQVPGVDWFFVGPFDTIVGFKKRDHKNNSSF